MRSFTLIFFLLLGTASAAFAQTFSIRGRVVDRVSGETLPGTSVAVVGTPQGGVSDGSGAFRVGPLAPGTYTLRVSFIGYVNLEQKVTITNRDENVVIRLVEDNNTLNEVQVVGQVAVERETPVAFSSVNEVRLRESLSSRDLPLILNETPGVYATQSGGGTGDSRISIRGFDQRNVAVLINGVPVNDMENGAVYWSNWDLGDVTKNLQVQRGLTASKLAVPAIGGLINVTTKGYDTKRGGRVRQEIGSNGYRKTSLLLNSGQMKGDWAVTVFGSRRKSDGWVDGTFDDAWTYFGTVSKKFGKHQVSITGLGSPQSHGQRLFATQIASFSHEKAVEIGANPAGVREYGFRYNQHQNTLNRWTINPDGTRKDDYQNYVERVNYYHKPQINLNHFWNVSDKLFISNVVYFSQGSGGGRSMTTSGTDSTGRIDLQGAYDFNRQNKRLIRTLRTGTTDQDVRDTENLSTAFIRAGVNNHKWFGFITSADYRINEFTTLSFGIDGRYYRGEHYREVYDLLGGDYALDVNATTQGPLTRSNNSYILAPNGGLLPSNNNNFTGNQQSSDPNRKLRVGDKYDYNYDGITRQLGGYGQLEYKKGPLSGFVSATGAATAYQRIDYFRAPRVTLADGRSFQVGTGITFVPKLDGSGNEAYTGMESVTVPRQQNTQYPTTAPTDTTLFIGYGNSVTYRNTRGENVTYYALDAARQGPVTSDVIVRPGFTFKTGFNYNLTEDNSIFFNIGYLNRPQYFTYIWPGTSGNIAPKFKNESVFSQEIGYSISRPSFKASLNAYNTIWYNRSATASVLDDQGAQASVNLSGLNETHRGVELDIAQEISRKVALTAALAVGDWRWNSRGSYQILDQNGAPNGSGNFDVRGVHVGNAAQNQVSAGVRVEPIAGLYVRPVFTLFAKTYTDFDVTKYPDNGVPPQDAFRLPTQRQLDIHAGYSKTVRVGGGHDYRITLNGSVLNALNQFFITDAPVGGVTDPFIPSKTFVFFNMGRRGTVGLAVDF